ncbi:MAG: hypothetical protein HC836_14955 [Richelia sp. RM2_1_2]|nr:hypothetical protein [Richelia sp. SM1_7_0]NJN09490.1 hypothetical protein [Richelia sp. RM1_1_1]NJO27208.1 hypothetical protein [Richelia sp. SL_2_1]NJO59546.1 hypothetical protein [Richelia sp. RM2_1_2]NJS16334.1 hypothetical protein [Nostocaceae cyanobacterium CSU_2_110]
MNIKNSLNIHVSETIIQRLRQTKETVFTDDWKQTAIQGSHNAMNTVTDTVQQAKSYLQKNLQPLSVQTVVTSSVADWFEQHPAFLKVITLFNWSINHPIISLIIILFSLAIFWNLIKVIGRLIESISLSILQIPLKLFQALIKYSWLWLSKLFSNFATNQFTDTKTLTNTLEYKLQDNTTYKIVSSHYKQQRLNDISARLEEIHKEQQELLQEAAHILDSERINNSVN